MHPTRIFKAPVELEGAWLKYKESLKERAKEWPQVQYVGKDGSRVTDYPKLPLTMDGFEVFCYKNYGCVNHYFDNTEEMYNDFCTICRGIRKEIRDDQITGGMLGDYNPSITQRLNGLKEATDVNHSGSVQILSVDPMDDGKA